MQGIEEYATRKGDFGGNTRVLFVRNHAKAIIAADFFVVVTATFRLVYVFIIMECEAAESFTST